jgi:CBS domain-containing protein
MFNLMLGARSFDAQGSDDFDEEPTRLVETIGGLVRGPAIAVGTELPLREVRRLLVDYRVAAIAVIDDDDVLVGLVTRTDVLRVDHATASAVDAMSTSLVSLPETAPIAKAAALVASEGVSQIVVFDHDESLLGIVSAVDLVRYFATNRQV